MIVVQLPMMTMVVVPLLLVVGVLGLGLLLVVQVVLLFAALHELPY